MHQRAITFCALLLAFFFIRSESVLAQAGGLESPIGKVMTLEGGATVVHSAAVVTTASAPSGSTRLKVGDPVYRGDLVQTGPDGKLGLAFTDGTAFNLSSGARMELNEFVYSPGASSNSSFFNLVEGSFTFVAGKIAKTGSMKVDTPAATMGIRGTTPHVVVAKNGTVQFSTLVEEKR